jgi:hypothetical protein
MQSAFHPHAQRNAFRRRDARLQSRLLSGESGNQKGNLSYLAGTKKRYDSLVPLIFHKRGARADEENDARALFFKQRG